MDAVDFFPFYAFRKYQKETIQYVQECFDSGYNVVMVEAPTGIGKSAINYCIFRHYGGYIVTTQKVLQEQYRNSFRDLHIIKGRSNYRCELVDVPADCAPCVVLDDFECDAIPFCDYYQDRNNVAKFGGVMNVSYAFLAPRNVFETKNVLIVDEAHNLDLLGLDFISVTIRTKLLRETVPSFKSCEEYADYLYGKLDDLYEVKRRYFEKFKKSKNILHLRTINSVDRLIKKIRFFYNDVADGNEWVFTRTKEKIKFQPITVGRFMKRLLWDLGRRYLVTSATIIDPKMFVKEVGLDFCEGIKFVRVPHVFPKERRPVKFIPCGSMGKDYKDRNMHIAAEVIKKILEKADGHRVLIHCKSYENAKMLYNMLEGIEGRKIILQDANDREKSLVEFLYYDNSVFLSVKYTEGVDFAYDKARVNIILKVPYPDLSDPRIKKRLEMEDGERWYRWKTIQELVQSYGRTTRAEDDWSYTFILDSDFAYLYHANKDLFPKWFKEALKWYKKKPMERQSQLELVRTVYRKIEEIYNMYGDFPSIDELAAELDMSKNKVSYAVKLLEKKDKVIIRKDKVILL